jgi:hypothetical protein
VKSLQLEIVRLGFIVLLLCGVLTIFFTILGGWVSALPFVCFGLGIITGLVMIAYSGDMKKAGEGLPAPRRELGKKKRKTKQ